MVITYKKVQDLKLKNFFNMYKYRITEQNDKAAKYQEERINAFEKIIQ